MHWTDYCLTRVVSYSKTCNTASYLQMHPFRLRRGVLLLFSSVDSKREYIIISHMALDVLLLSFALLLTFMHSFHAFALPQAPQLSICAGSSVGHLHSTSSGRISPQLSPSSKVSRHSTPGTKGVSCKAAQAS